jgi:hypothetical protein
MPDICSNNKNLTKHDFRYFPTMFAAPTFIAGLGIMLFGKAKAGKKSESPTLDHVIRGSERQAKAEEIQRVEQKYSALIAQESEPVQKWMERATEIIPRAKDEEIGDWLARVKRIALSNGVDGLCLHRLVFPS